MCSRPCACALVFVVIFSGLAAAIAAEPAKKPNILFCFADDMGRYAGAYAKLQPGGMGDLVRTPNIDRIAGEGVLFRNAFVNAPSCTPCRSALLSGQYFWRTGRGSILRGAVWDSSIPTFPLLLEQNGYFLGKAFKVWSPGTPADAPYGGQKHAYQKAGGRFNNFSENATEMVKAGKSVDDAKRELLAEVKENFNSFLAARPKDKPFCFWFGPTNVHRSFVRGSGKALWGLDGETLKGKLPPFLPDVPEVREDVADYFGEIAAFDAGIGVLLARLAEIGELENTLVVVSGDHGMPGVPYGKCNLYDFGVGVSLAMRGPGIKAGRVVDDFVSLPDLAPTFLEAGGVERPSVMTAKSLWPVLTSEKSGQVDPDRTWVLSGRERHVESARAGNLPYPQRALRTREYLYIVNFEPERWPLGDPIGLDDPEQLNPNALATDTRITFKDMDASPTKAWLIQQRKEAEWKPYFERAFGRRPREELYVLADDPHQVKNVADDPKLADVKKKLNEQLMAELTRSGDPRVTGDRMYFEKPPLAGPVDEERPGKAKN